MITSYFYYKKIPYHKAFTLIEMLIIVVIIGILAAALIPRLVWAQERARDAARNVKVWQIYTAIWLIKDDTWSYPIAPFYTNPTAQSTVAMIPNLTHYISSIPNDPWKGIAAVMSVNNSCVLTGDSFAYNSNSSWSWFAITSLNESKRGNTTNCLGVIDSLYSTSYQVIWDWLEDGIFWVDIKKPWIYRVWEKIIVTNWSKSYTLYYKNVWASVEWTWSNSFWHYFQWGNNYWFPNQWSVLRSSTLVSNPTIPYNNNIFVMNTNFPYDWITPQNTNLRPEKTQWPCNNWYHIPTQAEWQWLYNVWLSVATWASPSAGDLRRNTLLIPRAGNRDHSNSYVYNQFFYGYYWSSTPSDIKSYIVRLSSSSIDTLVSSNRVLGFSVRCFAD